MPRLSIAPRTTVTTTQAPSQTFSSMMANDDLIVRITEIWQADLLALRHELRPWYIRLWDWWHGR